MFRDDEQGNPCGNHGGGCILDWSVEFDGLHRSGHDAAGLYVIWIESLRHDFMDDVGRGHDADAALGVLDQQAGDPLLMHEQSGLADRDISGDLYDARGYHVDHRKR